MSAPLPLDGRAAVVTGGTKGIGLAIAHRLRCEGAAVTIASRREHNLAQALDVLHAEGDGLAPVHAVAANAGDGDDARRCIDEVVARHGRVDILVNNAAANPYQGPLVGLPASAAAKTAQVNQWGPVLWAQLAWEAHMAEAGGSIVNVTSIGGLTVDRGIGYYNATKAALGHLTRQLAFEMAPRVRVNAVAPGLIKTDMARTLWEEREAELAALMPLRRLGETADIAAAVAFLAGDDASWVTGQVLAVDGGAMTVPLDIGLHHPDEVEP